MDKIRNPTTVITTMINLIIMNTFSFWQKMSAVNFLLSIQKKQKRCNIIIRDIVL